MERNSFWAKVARRHGGRCWEWTASTNNKGYGRFRPAQSATEWLAHRWSFILHNGAIPNGAIILHTCDNRRCVNPAHLVAGSHYDNNHDCIAKGRARKNSPKGERQYHAKLTDREVIDIRRAYIGGERLADIQGRYGLAFRTITAICYGSSWRHLLGKDGAPALSDLARAKREKASAIITPNEVRQIRRMHAEGKQPSAIAADYGISRQNVYSITRRLSWRDVD